MIQLYTFPLSTNGNKVRYLMDYMNIAYEFHDIDLPNGEHHQPEYLQINPYAKVPAINDDGFMLAESNAIIRYLADKYKSNLYPQELQKRAVVDQWLDYAAQDIAIPFARITMNLYFYKLVGVTPDSRALEDSYDLVAKNLPVVESQLNKAKYITGDDFTLADFAMLAAIDAAELSKVDLSKYPSITRWRSKLMKQDFYTKCRANYIATFNNIFQQ